MADYQAEFRRIIDEELGDYAERAVQLLAAAIQAKGLVLTADLLDSLQAQVVKAGAISKEQYEAQKSAIKTDYDAKTCAIKRDAAEKEKQLNSAQAIIQGTLAVIKAAPNVPLMVEAGATAAAGLAKIIATDISEFEDGGIFGGRKSGLAARVSRAAGQAWRGVK
jgi:hypothetical protein